MLIVVNDPKTYGFSHPLIVFESFLSFDLLIQLKIDVSLRFDNKHQKPFVF